MDLKTHRVVAFHALWLVFASVASAQIAPKPATEITAAVNARMYQVLDFSDQQDFEDATRGFIAGLEPPRIIPNNIPLLNELGYYAWNMEGYQFMYDFGLPNIPPSVNPSLWRQELLNNINGLFEVVPDRIYQVRGYDMATMTFLRTSHGWIVIDPLTAPESARAGLELLRDHVSTDPVVAIVVTHSHTDHYSGMPGILQAEGKPLTPAGMTDPVPGTIPFYAPAGFYEEAISENLYLGNAMMRRADYMYGSYLARNVRGHIGSGLGKTTGFGIGQLMQPTQEIPENGSWLIDGLILEFQLAPNTEAPAEMHVFVPAYSALCPGENVTHTMHNLLTSRGAKVRDPKAFATYIDEALDLFGPDMEVLIGTHHWPVWGNARCVELLENQRDMYRFFNDQVIRMANNGMNMEEAAEAFELPQALDSRFYNRGYYGTINHNVKAVMQRYIGWWDGNPANYFKYPEVVAAKKYVEFMGGEGAVIAKAQKSYRQGDYRWVAEVMKHVVLANPENQKARNLQADAFEQLGYTFESGTWRNIFLSGAEELRNGNIGPPFTPGNNTLGSLPPTLIFEFFSTLVMGKKAESLDLPMRFLFTDNGLPASERNLYVRLKNGVLHTRTNKPDLPVGATYTLSREALMGLLKDPTNLSGIEVQGNGYLFAQLVAHFDKPLLTKENRLWNIVLPLDFDNTRPLTPPKRSGGLNREQR